MLLSIHSGGVEKKIIIDGPTDRLSYSVSVTQFQSSEVVGGRRRDARVVTEAGP